VKILGGGLAMFVAAIMSITAVPPPARGDALDAFTDFYSYVTTGYDLFDKYVVSQQPSDLAQMQAAISQAKIQIIAELDGLAAAWNSSCAANAVDTFENIDKLTTSNLQAFAISSDRCVTNAQTQIGAVTDKHAIDKIGFALNTVGPIALFANTAAGFATDVLRQRVIDANRQIRTRLTPVCTTTINDPNALPGIGDGPITGRGVCFHYTLSKPQPMWGGVTWITPGLAWRFCRGRFAGTPSHGVSSRTTTTSTSRRWTIRSPRTRSCGARVGRSPAPRWKNCRRPLPRSGPRWP
jgi:hypothetical protein